MNIEIKITGSGDHVDISTTLRRIADDIYFANFMERLKLKGEVEWEDTNLFTTITEEV